MIKPAKHVTIAALALLTFSFSATAQMGGGGGGMGGMNGGGGTGSRGNRGVYDPGVRPENKEKLTPEEKAKMQTTRMRKDLKLDEEQTKKIGEINLRYATQIDEQINNSPEMNDYTKAIITRLQNSQQEEVKAVLTDEQWNAMQRKKKERQQQMQQQMQDRRGQPQQAPPDQGF